MKRRMTAASLAAVLLAACGGGGTGGAADGGGEGASPTPTATETSGEIRVAMEDNFFQPASLEIPAGAELELDNEGQAPHTFTVEGGDVDVEVAAGEDAKTRIDLEPGTYTVVCRFHEAQGMRGSITVT